MIKEFKLDKSGKTNALYFKKNISRNLTNKILNNLIQISKIKQENIRLCFHEKKNSELHNMVNIIYKKNNTDKYHKHLFKDEIYHLIKGSIEINIILNKKKKKILLNKNNTIYRMTKNTFHKVNSLSRFSIFHEIRKGPFKKGDSIFK